MQTITSELTKAHSEISQLLTLTKLCNDKNPGIVLKNCFRSSMQQSGVELPPEAIIEHKKRYFSTSKSELTKALAVSKVVASEHRLFFQCIVKLMKYWSIISLNQSQRFKIAIGTFIHLLLRLLPHSQIPADCAHYIVDSSSIRRDAMVPLLVSSNGPILLPSEKERKLLTLTMSIYNASSKQRVVHFDTWESVSRSDNELNLHGYYQHDNLVHIHSHCERVKHASYCLQLFAFLCNDSVELHDRWVTASNALTHHQQGSDEFVVLINEVFNKMKVEIISLTRSSILLALSAEYTLSIDLVPINGTKSSTNHPDLLHAVKYSFNETNRFLLQYALSLAQDGGEDGGVKTTEPVRQRLNKSILHHYLKLLKLTIDNCYIKTQLKELKDVFSSSFGYDIVYNVDVSATTSTKIVYQLCCNSISNVVLHVDCTGIEILFGDASSGIKFNQLSDFIDELFKVICHTSLLTSITAVASPSNALTISPINYNRFQLAKIDGSSIGMVVYHGRIRDTQHIVKLYLFSVTNVESIEKELSKSKVDRSEGLLYDSRSSWAVPWARVVQVMSIIVNNL